MAGSDPSEPISRIQYRSNVVTALPDPATVVGAAGSISLTVAVDQAGGAITLDTDCRSTLLSPSGSWPYTYQVQPGQGTTATISFATAAVQSSTTVSIRACSSQLDISDPASWQATASVTVVPA